jgi:hypothetical protein
VFPNPVFSYSPLGAVFLLKLQFFLIAYIGGYEFSAFSLFAPRPLNEVGCLYRQLQRYGLRGKASRLVTRLVTNGDV